MLISTTGERKMAGGARPWLARRLFFPSLTDLFFSLVLTIAFLTGGDGWQALLQDGDTGYHIRTGAYILASRQIPAHDLFSFSRPGAPWYAWEWLSDVIFAGLHSLAGLKGVVLFTAILLTAVFTLVLRDALQRGANSLLTLALMFTAINASYVHLFARPHIFTFLFVVGAMILIRDDRTRHGARIWLLAPLTAIWANLHGGFVLLFPLLGLLAIGSAAEAWLDRAGRARRISDSLRYVGVALACGLASLLNPYGIQLHLHIFQSLGARWLIDLVSEFNSPTFHSGPSAFMLLLFLALAAVTPLLRKGKVTEPLWLLFLAYCALVSVRHIPIFALVATPIVAVEATAWWNDWIGRLSRRSTPRILDDIAGQMRTGFAGVTLWTPAFLAAIAFAGGMQWPTDISADHCPAALIRRHADPIASARILTVDQWADYLIYHYYPRQRVFFDGRSDFYGEQMALDYLKMTEGRASWKETLDKYRFDMVLCPVNWPLASLLRYQPDWRATDDDGKAVLFEKIRLNAAIPAVPAAIPSAASRTWPRP